MSRELYPQIDWCRRRDSNTWQRYNSILAIYIIDIK
jgi:hypothetical protein